MSIVFSSFLLFFTIITSFLTVRRTLADAKALHTDELKALGEIANTLGIKNLNLSYGDPCQLESLKIDDQNPDSTNSITCDCSFNNKSTCHITELKLKTLSLPGKLPPELVKLRYLQTIDFCRNYLSGTIPVEWASLPYFTSISLCANRLSGPLPAWLQKFKNLTFLGVEANQFSGPIPDELGNLTSLTKLHLASNQFNGSLPATLARLVNLKDFRVSDNNFSGTIPASIGNWSGLQRLHIQASGLKGPIPDAVTRLENLAELRISDTTGIDSFPILTSKAIGTLTLRNVNLSGPIPPYIWNLTQLTTLDLSFNTLTGEVKALEKAPAYTYLTGNMLSGNFGSGLSIDEKTNIDLSYNNFSWSSTCKDKRNVTMKILQRTIPSSEVPRPTVPSLGNINTYRSSYLKNNLTGLLPCAGLTKCKRYQRSLHINCGGESVTITNTLGKVTYQADKSETKAATNQHFENWGISNTGVSSNDIYTISTSLTLPGGSPDIYKTARRSAISLVYYAFCLKNGAYNVKLHFMEIQFSDQEPYSRLGRRIFDVYVQGELFLRDFNIKEEANGTLKPVVKEAVANVTDNVLEIRLYWAGKGTALIPARGSYGPLISAISLCHTSKQWRMHMKLKGVI